MPEPIPPRRAARLGRNEQSLPARTIFVRPSEAHRGARIRAQCKGERMKRFGFWPIVAFILLAVPLLVMGFNPPPFGNTGAPGDGTCGSCHSGVSTGGSVVATFPSGTSYTPGVAQNLTVTVNDTTHTVWAFELAARLASNTATQAGSFTAGTNTAVVSSGAIQEMENTASGSNQKTWTFAWTPPATNVGNVNFYLIGLAAGGSGG